MRSYISYDELEELGETIVRAYINKTRRYNALCVDIEGLVTDYLGLTVVYETIVEDDLNKIAFLSNGKRPLRVVRDGKRVEVVFPKNTAVLDKVLVEYYGAPTPVTQLAAVSVPEARTLLIQPWSRRRTQHHRQAEPNAGCGMLS